MRFEIELCSIMTYVYPDVFTTKSSFSKKKTKNYNNLFIFEILTYTSFYKNFFNVMSGITFMSSKTTKNQIILPRKNSLATV